MFRNVALVFIFLCLVMAWFSRDLTRAVFEALAFFTVLLMLAVSFSSKKSKRAN